MIKVVFDYLDEFKRGAKALRKKYRPLNLTIIDFLMS